MALTEFEKTLVQTSKLSGDAILIFRFDRQELRLIHWHGLSEGFSSILSLVHGKKLDNVLQAFHLQTEQARIEAALNSAIENDHLTENVTTLRLSYGTGSFELKMVALKDPTKPIPCSNVICSFPSTYAMQAFRDNLQTEQHHMIEDRLRMSEDSFQKLVESCPVPIILHRDLKIIYVNSTAIKQMKMEQIRDMEGRSLLDFLHPSVHIEFERRVSQLQSGLTLPPAEGMVKRGDGETVPVEITSISLPKDGEPAVLSIVQDITDKKNAMNALEELAYYDPLTRLPNRRLFRKQTVEALFNFSTNTAFSGDKQVSILFIDFDGFKEINDGFGHEAGDQVLYELSRRLKRVIDPERDILARLAGDEFVITRTRTNVFDTEELVQQLLSAFSHPVDTLEQERHVTLSVGIALSPDDGTDYDDLVRHADTAMYQAKRQGGNCYTWYQSKTQCSS